jgi:SAM-dependent MidA family methyltransferase
MNVETDASSLLSSRWPADNLLTFEPSRLYTGAIYERVTPEHLTQVVRSPWGRSLELEVSSVRMGVFTWDLFCTSRNGPLLLVVPRVLDEPAPSGRQKTKLPELYGAHMAYFWERGLRRYLEEPLKAPEAPSPLPVHIVSLDPSYRTLTFGRGAIRLDLVGNKLTWVVGLGPHMTQEALITLISAIAYHYEATEEGGTTLTDFYINDGDFMMKRREDGSLAVRLVAMRRREPHVCPARLLLYLTQLAAYEDFEAGGELYGVPTLMSNPSLAFEGWCRGRIERALDLGLDEARAHREARDSIAEFAHSPEGFPFRRFALRYLNGELKPEFGRDLREPWWQLGDLKRRAEIARLEADGNASSANAKKAQALGTLIARLESQIGNREARPESDERIRFNDLSRPELQRWLSAAGVSDVDGVASRFLERWPYRNFDHLLGEVPEAKKLKKYQRLSDFGSVFNAQEESLTLGKMGRDERRRERLLANAEAHGALTVPEAEVERARATFLSFEEFMDAALQDETWGYYATSVVIGKRGHFTTSPERLSPDYGRWLAERAFELYSELARSNRLGSEPQFTIVEFGAGTGRLGLDFLTALEGPAPKGVQNPDEWAHFSRAVEYRIYEKSARLRAKQAELLGGRAQVFEGDARAPGQALKRDFPNGLRGLILTNEVPDAFGVHKMLLHADGRALVALTVPHVTSSALEFLPAEFASRIRDRDAELRALFSFPQRGGYLLDRELFYSCLGELAKMGLEARERLSLEIEVDEAYVPARAFPELKQHLERNLEEYALGLAREPSGVILYPNLHADRFIVELGESLVAGGILTLDYGQTTLGLIQGARRGHFLFRVYFDGEPFVPRPNDPYTRIGLQDLTADVNFTALASAGKAARLEVLHFGPERDIAGPAARQLVASGRQHEERWAEFLGTPHFKVLVQGPERLSLFAPSGLGRLALFQEDKDLSPEARARLPAILNALKQS